MERDTGAGVSLIPKETCALNEQAFKNVKQSLLSFVLVHCHPGPHSVILLFSYLFVLIFTHLQ